MSQRIRLGNTYNHEEYGLVLTTHRDGSNIVWFRPVVGHDNAGVISTEERIEREPYKKFLGNVRMRDYPDDWSSIARAVKQRDDHVCQGCGASKDGPHTESGDSQRGCGDEDSDELHAHHIVPLGAGGSNARSNLITLCDECHGRVHGGVT